MWFALLAEYILEVYLLLDSIHFVHFLTIYMKTKMQYVLSYLVKMKLTLVQNKYVLKHFQIRKTRTKR